MELTPLDSPPLLQPCGGAHVVMGVRNMAAGKQVQEAIVKEIPTAKVDAMELDLSSMASLKLSVFDSMLVLLRNNAGHFLLTHLLLDNMKKTARKSFVSKLSSILLKNLQQGAATTCYVALHPQVKGVSGAYFSDSNLAKTTELAKDIDLAKRLWDFSMNLIK
ncbi:hypothetical protein L1987_71101 [Smallanthus sonchifolius]|uniref:Uncharacterized protein n=1 Tax=Smallanthus sonchifolius TaxID=185202 RepID=A0ACB9ART4_9ASTR|nr:hypothetical protein L1987_71101 [Smallanthus sonchifolius]